MARNEYPESEGLQVVPAHEGLQVVPPQPGLEVAHSSGVEKLEKGGDPAYQGIEVAPGGGLESAQPAHRKGTATYCGLRKRTFAIAAGIILVAVIVAAVVGGVVGSKHSTSNKNVDNPAVSGSSSSGTSPTKTASHTTTTQPHSTTTSSTGPVPTTALPLDCPAINGTSRAIKSSNTGTAFNFDLYCETDFAPREDTGGINATRRDGRVQGCINLIELGAPCVGVVWDSVLNLAIGHNCFFKDSTEGGLLISKSYKTHPAAATLVR
ncbi:hypothetical protein VE04_00687 [Pseudogymnoascus sp. 24MN13]|nr:hypothetical protein VE04_00687 [Pseudogymnoascus sp. 24MN13]